jgi:hypothetical protein
MQRLVGTAVAAMVLLWAGSRSVRERGARSVELGCDNFSAIPRKTSG